MIYSRTTRILHALLALTITFQLIVSLVMDHPHAARPMSHAGAIWFEWHEWVGLAAVAVLLAGWIYRLMHFQREGQGRLFPWLNAPGRSKLVTESRQLLSLKKWKTLPETGALAGAIHGLGLLIASAMAVTGGVLYLRLWPANIVTGNTANLMDLHSNLATIMWAYLYGHGLMAVWHQYIGHASISKMFRLR